MCLELCWAGAPALRGMCGGESVMGFGATNAGQLVHGANNLTSLTSRLLTCDVEVIAT